MGRVLVVAAHPDDEILGMGATMAAHVDAGDQVSVLWVTDGSSTQYPGRPDLLARKYEEADAALAELGVAPAIRGALPDMSLNTVSHVRCNRVVESAVEQARAEVVYCVHPDVNLDHRAVHESVSVATRPRPGAHVRRVLSYAATSSAEWTPPFRDTFSPTWFVDVTDTLDAKLRAFDRHRTEHRPWPHPRSARAVTARAESWGSAVGVAAAEPFVLVREIRT